MARALNKVHKKISKKRGGKLNSLHENSRDAGRLRAAGAREDKLSRMMDAAVRANQVYGMLLSLMAEKHVANRAAIQRTELRGFSRRSRARWGP